MSPGIIICSGNDRSYLKPRKKVFGSQAGVTRHLLQGGPNVILGHYGLARIVFGHQAPLTRPLGGVVAACSTSR